MIGFRHQVSGIRRGVEVEVGCRMRGARSKLLVARARMRIYNNGVLFMYYITGY